MGRGHGGRPGAVGNDIADRSPQSPLGGLAHLRDRPDTGGRIFTPSRRVLLARRARRLRNPDRAGVVARGGRPCPGAASARGPSAGRSSHRGDVAVAFHGARSPCTRRSSVAMNAGARWAVGGYIFAALAAGCAADPPPPAVPAAPAAFDNAPIDHNATWPSERWYREFSSDELSSFIEAAAKNNLDLA